jgi:hypothetical protein
MESLLLVAPCPYDAEFKARLGRAWPVVDAASGVMVVEDSGSRVYVARNDSAAEELEPESRARILAAMPAPVFYTVDFSDMSLVRRVLTIIGDDSRLLIDDDHGVRLPGHDFVRMLRDRPDWDWRRDAA